MPPQRTRRSCRCRLADPRPDQPGESQRFEAEAAADIEDAHPRADRGGGNTLEFLKLFDCIEGSERIDLSLQVRHLVDGSVQRQVFHAAPARLASLPNMQPMAERHCPLAPPRPKNF